MAIEYNETIAQTIQFDSIVGGATLRNIRLVVYPTTPSNYNEALYFIGAAELTGVILNYGNNVYDVGKFTLQANYSGTNGTWYTTNDVLTVDAVNEILITLDGSSLSNDPAFYVNGVSVGVTEKSTPTGSIDASATITPYIGAITGPSPAGKILSAEYITGRIVGGGEALDFYNSRLAIPTTRGLVFAPALWGAAGNIKDGDTLAAANEVTDIISGARGVPSGSPVFRGTHI